MNQLHGAAKSDHADADAEVHTIDQRLQQEARESRSCRRAVLYALELLPDSQDAQGHAMEAGLTDHVWDMEELIGLMA
jgi:hypothetical protein